VVDERVEPPTDGQEPGASHLHVAPAAREQEGMHPCALIRERGDAGIDLLFVGAHVLEHRGDVGRGRRHSVAVQAVGEPVPFRGGEGERRGRDQDECESAS
jgi:hypothetical protein